MKLTRDILFFIALAMVAYDVWAKISGRVPTFSFIITSGAHEYLTIAFAAGYLAGHLFGGT